MYHTLVEFERDDACIDNIIDSESDAYSDFLTNHDGEIRKSF